MIKTEGISFKEHGGMHSDKSSNRVPLAACIELIANYNGSKKENASKEFDHPQYDKFTVEPVNEIGGIRENKLYAFKYVTWVRTDKKCVNRLYCDPDPVKPDGTLNNVYNLYAEWIDDGQLPTGAKDKYHYNGTIANWGGHYITARIDGVFFVDVGAISIRSIISPSETAPLIHSKITFEEEVDEENEEDGFRNSTCVRRTCKSRIWFK